MEIDVLSFERMNAPSLRASIALRIRTPELTLAFRSCGLHERNGRRWITFPTQRSGRALSTPVRIPDRNEHQKFQVLALDAVDKYLATSDSAEVAA